MYSAIIGVPFNSKKEELGSSGISVKVGFASPSAEIFCILENLHEVLLSHAAGKAKPKPGKLFSSCPHQSVLFSQAVKTFRGINALFRAFILMSSGVNG